LSVLVEAYLFADAPLLSREEARASLFVAGSSPLVLTEALRPFFRGESVECRALPAPGASIKEAPFALRVGVRDLARGLRARLVLDPRLVRRGLRLVLGADEESEAPRPISAGEEGLWWALLLSALHGLPGAESWVLCEAPAAPLAVPLAFDVSLGGVRGWALVSVDAAWTPRAVLRPAPAWTQQVVCAGSLVVGRASLSPEERASLRPGDSIIPDALSLDERGDGAARLHIAGLCADVSLRTGRAALLGGLMAEHAPGPSLQVSIELGQVKARVEELSAWTAGTVLPLGRRPGDPVELFCDGKLIARGEVVRVESELGVRLLWVADSPQ
jgi:hypothetical protein